MVVVTPPASSGAPRAATAGGDSGLSVSSPSPAADAVGAGQPAAPAVRSVRFADTCESGTALATTAPADLFADFQQSARRVTLRTVVYDESSETDSSESEEQEEEETDKRRRKAAPAAAALATFDPQCYDNFDSDFESSSWSSTDSSTDLRSDSGSDSPAQDENEAVYVARAAVVPVLKPRQAPMLPAVVAADSAPLRALKRGSFTAEEVLPCPCVPVCLSVTT